MKISFERMRASVKVRKRERLRWKKSERDFVESVENDFPAMKKAVMYVKGKKKW